MDRLPVAPVAEIALDPAFVEISHLDAVTRHPNQEPLDHVEASPSTLSRETILDKPCRVALNKLSVRSVLEPPESMAAAQVRFCVVILTSAVQSGLTRGSEIPSGR